MRFLYSFMYCPFAQEQSVSPEWGIPSLPVQVDALKTGPTPLSRVRASKEHFMNFAAHYSCDCWRKLREIEEIGKKFCVAQVLKEENCWLNLSSFCFKILHSTGLEFQHQVEEAKDLDQLIKIHYRYLSTIHDRCLLREKVWEASPVNLDTEARMEPAKDGCLSALEFYTY